MILDAGVFIALENASQRRVVLALIEMMQAEGVEPKTNEAALAQAWRDPGRQVPLAMLVKATTVYPLGDPKVIGMRCAQAGTNDVVDASLAVLADQLEMAIVTTDPADMARLGVACHEL
ncbi:MAG: hypothetical protein GY724_11325 [Actinomycetia bacterium]|nr:hypothetical protein [Actinomycetes bacterium]MCP5034297.1 hypothetical protein [Actinomycetes bacterium]